MTIFYCLRFETPSTWKARSPYLYPPGTGWLSYTPRHWVPSLSPPTIRRATVEVFESASTRKNYSCQSHVTTAFLLPFTFIPFLVSSVLSIHFRKENLRHIAIYKCCEVRGFTQLLYRMGNLDSSVSTVTRLGTGRGGFARSSPTLLLKHLIQSTAWVAFSPRG
jgi:hypothetical protein